MGSDQDEEYNGERNDKGQYAPGNIPVDKIHQRDERLEAIDPTSIESEFVRLLLDTKKELEASARFSIVSGKEIAAAVNRILGVSWIDYQTVDYAFDFITTRSIRGSSIEEVHSFDRAVRAHRLLSRINEEGIDFSLIFQSAISSDFDILSDPENKTGQYLRRLIRAYIFTFPETKKIFWEETHAFMSERLEMKLERKSHLGLTKTQRNNVNSEIKKIKRDLELLEQATNFDIPKSIPNPDIMAITLRTITAIKSGSIRVPNNIDIEILSTFHLRTRNYFQLEQRFVPIEKDRSKRNFYFDKDCLMAFRYLLKEIQKDLEQ